jgi:hypothetical protein
VVTTATKVNIASIFICPEDRNSMFLRNDGNYLPNSPYAIISHNTTETMRAGVGNSGSLYKKEVVNSMRKGHVGIRK